VPSWAAAPSAHVAPRQEWIAPCKAQDSAQGA
jgi:hypothetical protein